jgi:uncharacterized membrane protein
LPIIGSFLGILVLLYGFFVKSKHTRLAGYYILIISAIGALITFATGEPAEEIVENVAGISGRAINNHEEAAELAMIFMNLTGLSALAGVISEFKFKKLKKPLLTLTIILGLISSVAISYTGYLGGKIRHTEFDTTQSQSKD